MRKRACPACGCPAVSVWRLLQLGSLRRAACENCRASIGVTWQSSLAVLLVGTWLPVVGGVMGAIAGAGIGGNNVATFIGVVVGSVLSAALFASIYFRLARLIVV